MAAATAIPFPVPPSSYGVKRCSTLPVTASHPSRPVLPAKAASAPDATAPPDDLQIDVRGIGRLQLPAPEAQAKQLSQINRPARYGKGQVSVLDRAVGDTREVSKKQRFARRLLPRGAALVYAPGSSSATREALTVSCLDVR
jgi:hypothetical protein